MTDNITIYFGHVDSPHNTKQFTQKEVKSIVVAGIEFLEHKYVEPNVGSEAILYSEGEKYMGPTRVKSLSRNGLHIFCFPHTEKDAKAWLLRRVRESFLKEDGSVDRAFFIDKLVKYQWGYRNVAPHVTREFIRDERKYLEANLRTKK